MSMAEREQKEAEHEMEEELSDKECPNICTQLDEHQAAISEFNSAVIIPSKAT